MIKTGSKFLFALSAFGLVGAYLYANGTGHHKTLGIDSITGPLSLGYKGYVGEHVGYSILIGLFVVALVAGIILSAVRDADPESAAQVLDLDTVPEVPAPAAANYWPVVGGFSLGLVALGLAVDKVFFAVGLIGLGATTVEWAVRAWSDRATGDPEVNASIRNRLMYPVEIPGAAVIGIAVLVLSVSRILLALPPGGKYAVFAGLPVLVMVIGVVAAYRPKLSSSAIAGVLVIVALAIVAGGVAAGIHGPRKESEGKTNEKQIVGVAPLPTPPLTVIRAGR